MHLAESPEVLEANIKIKVTTQVFRLKAEG